MKSFFFSSCLGFHFIDLCFQLFGICQIVIAEGIKILIKLIDERDSCGDVQLNNIWININLPFSLTLLSFLTIALIEFPWATTKTLFPYFTLGTMVCYQNGITLSMVLFKLFNINMGTSVKGKSSALRSLYLLSFLGCLSSLSSRAGGGISKLLLQICTCSFPCFSTVSNLFSPCKAP